VIHQQKTNSAFYRFIPFVIFICFIGLDEIIRLCAGLGFFTIETTTLYYLYPVRTLITGFLLYLFKEHYHELSTKDITNIPSTIASCIIGILVFALWIKMDWTFSATGAPQGFNPMLFPGRTIQVIMIIFRIAGAVLVVPLMEELFWRSYLIRSLINKDFDNVRIGTFSWASFIITIVLFGLEHNYILAGIMAGFFYNLVLYKNRSLAQCVLAHSVTNLALAIYVVYTGKWQFW
jgi:CAAX prenyl protease-like protein